LSALVSHVTSSQSLDAAALIGRGVLAAGDRLTLQGGAALFGIELPQAADQVVVTIRDAAGVPVHTVSLGPKSAGTAPLNWDGRTDSGVAAAEGPYSFTVSAEQGERTIGDLGLDRSLISAVRKACRRSVTTCGPKLLSPDRHSSVRLIRAGSARCNRPRSKTRTSISPRSSSI
jgi:flagellar hook assembly protein FlgD